MARKTFTYTPVPPRVPRRTVSAARTAGRSTGSNLAKFARGVATQAIAGMVPGGKAALTAYNVGKTLYKAMSARKAGPVRVKVS